MCSTPQKHPAATVAAFAPSGMFIGWAGAERLAAGLTDPLDVPARARWPLDPSAERARGAGVKA